MRIGSAARLWSGYLFGGHEFFKEDGFAKKGFDEANGSNYLGCKSK